jgi:cell wall-associated NlpC family hydrolase/N-acetylmuramoyl-L-alanine amidase
MRRRAAAVAAAFACLAAAAFAKGPARAGTDRPFEPTGKPLEGLVVALDPAGGGEALTGAQDLRGTASGVRSADLNAMAAAHLRHHLLGAGAKVFLTRPDDRPSTGGGTTADEADARLAVVRGAKPHLLVSLSHYGAPPGANDGIIARISGGGRPDPLAASLAKTLAETAGEQVLHLGAPVVRETTEPLIVHAGVPAVTIEFGNLHHPDFDEWVSQQGRHRDEAIGLYHGIERAWKEHGAELARRRAAAFPGAKDDVPTSAAAKRRVPEGVPAEVAALADSLWPFGRPPANEREASWLIDNYRRRVLTDWTFCHLQAEVKKNGAGWTLRAKSNIPMLPSCVAGLLRTVGCEPLAVDLEQLPAARLGAKAYGIVKAPMALNWGSPAEGDDVQTQLLLGEWLFLLDETPDGAYLLAHGGDGYVGWVRSDSVLRVGEKEFNEWVNAPAAIVTREHVTNGFRVPAGASLPLANPADAGRRARPDGGAVRLRLPAAVVATGSGAEIDIPAEDLRLPAAEPAGVAVVRAAMPLMTVPYVFGGRSPIGIDCSGLTGVSYAAAGLTLPRDARQQILVGKLVATPWNTGALQAGDLLFFCDKTGRVIHTAISLGGGGFIHASPPEVQVNSLDLEDPLYSELWTKAFVFARRPLR